MSDIPYRRVPDWNEGIIQPVNKLAAEPQVGCEPLDPLPEAEPEHIWKKKDVTDVHDLLKKICPDNTFTDPDKWKQQIVDEIEEALKRGWCDCDCNGETSTHYGPYPHQLVYARPHAESTRTVMSIVCPGQIGVYHEISGDYIGCDWYNQSVSLSEQSESARLEAWSATTQYCDEVTQTRTIAQNMDDYQDKVDEYARYCKAAKTCEEFNIYAAEAEKWQKKVDTEFDKFGPRYAKIAPAEVKADQWAATASLAAVAIPVRFVGVDKNWYAEFMGPDVAFTRWIWKQWYNPYVDKGIILDIYKHPGYLAVPYFTANGKYRTTEWSVGQILTSPSGVPVPPRVDLLTAELAIPHCDHWGWSLCEGVIEPCGCGSCCETITTWGPEPWYWSGGCLPGFAGWVWEPVMPTTPGDYDVFSYDVIHNAFGCRYKEDNTKKQEQFYREHMDDWYIIHPKFDRRDYHACDTP
jgi:hypothetical protein